jgi:hypothetical protein
MAETQALSQMSRDNLVAVANKLAAGAQSARRSLARIREASKDPLKLCGEQLSGAGGAALSGVIAGLTPTASKFQFYDTGLGILTALASLAGAGSYGGDLIASMGIGMYSPGISRFVASKIHEKRGR